MMTKRDRAAKAQIINKLYEEGYRVYGRLLSYFDLNLTDSPEHIGYMIPGKAQIVVNENLDIEQVSFVVRHEILHEFLDHQLRMQRHKPDHNHQLANIAGDYEISNVGYTDADKRTAKHIKLNGQTLEGLVTDLDHPEWVNLTLEQIYDELEKEYDKQEPEMKEKIKIDNPLSDDVMKGWNDFVDMSSDLDEAELAEFAKTIAQLRSDAMKSNPQIFDEGD